MGLDLGVDCICKPLEGLASHWTSIQMHTSKFSRLSQVASLRIHFLHVLWQQQRMAIRAVWSSAPEHGLFGRRPGHTTSPQCPWTPYHALHKQESHRRIHLTSHRQKTLTPLTPTF